LPPDATLAAMEPDTSFDEAVHAAVESLPDDLSSAMSNVAIVVEDEPPDGQPLLGLYEGIPLTERSSYYAGVRPDKISIYQGPLERLYGHDPELLQEQIRRVVLHEIAHHFGIDDDRLRELDRY
jgi:predicted Zn-dependent protease with MMP-like domain